MASGAQPADFLSYLDTYYGSPSSNVIDAETVSNSNVSERKLPTVDRPFQEQVWRWLTKHPEIRVGRDNESCHLSLSEAEGIRSSTQSKKKKRGPLSQVLLSSSQAQDPVHLQHPPHSSESLGLTRELDESYEHATSKPNVRLFTSEDRIWNAVAGHGPDLQRIPKMEFLCLSIITSRQTKGILQADLVKITGQDKRSVPKRTQNLHDHGYIEKTPVLVNGTRTSWLYAKRFAPKPVNLNDRTAAVQTEKSGHVAPEQSRGEVIEYRAVFDGIFEILKEAKSKLITVVDLTKILVGEPFLALHLHYDSTVSRRPGKFHGKDVIDGAS